LVGGGQETTRNTMAAGTFRLLKNPDLLHELTDRPDLVPTFFEEILRCDSPFSGIVRHAAGDIDFHGHELKKGDKLALWLAAGNRDPKEFEEPNTFDPGRNPNRHVSFGGGGPHFCLGVLLARMQGTMFFEEMLPLFSRLEPAGAPTRHITAHVNAWAEAPVRWKR
jgi:cholest-4-en-3-one 26-monooxygenase